MAASPRALVLVALTAGVLALPSTANAGGGGCANVTEGSGTTVEFLNFCISPTILRVDRGDEVTFVNRDGFRHVITGAGYRWGSPGNFGPGDFLEVTFRQEGVYPYQCYLHPGMAGAVIVGTGEGLGAADRGGVVVASPEKPQPEIVYFTRPPEVRTVTRTSGSVPLVTGIGIGVAATAALALGARVAVRRRAPAAER